MNKKGFTLIEILVAMTIVAVLMGLALVSYQGARKSARDGKRKVDLEQVRSALEMCRADTGSYPVGPLYSGADISCGTPAVIYITIPSDSLADRRYVYTRPTVNNYTLCAALEVSGSTVTGCGSCEMAPAVVPCNFKTTNP